jgi:hypothetical protein
MDKQNCQECNGSGACDPCDGYGFYPDSYPGAGDGPECEYCTGSGDCPDCHGNGNGNGNGTTSTTSATAAIGRDDEHQKVSA